MLRESPDHCHREAHGRTRARGAVLAIAGSLLLAACGGSKVSTTAGRPSTQPAGPSPVSAAAPTATVVEMSVAGYGPVLTDPKGFVLYTYTADEPGGTGCAGACLKLWPPLLLPAGVAAPVAGPGVSGLSTLARPEGTEVTYEGLPLYTYLNDTRPGQVSGQDVVDSGGTWILATIPSASVPSTSVPASTAASTSPTTANPAVTSPPATQPPVTKGPITSPPVTKAAVPSRPVTQPRVTSPHATTAPTTPRTSPATSPPPGISY